MSEEKINDFTRFKLVTVATFLMKIQADPEMKQEIADVHACIAAKILVCTTIEDVNKFLAEFDQAVDDKINAVRL